MAQSQSVLFVFAVEREKSPTGTTFMSCQGTRHSRPQQFRRWHDFIQRSSVFCRRQCICCLRRRAHITFTWGIKLEINICITHAIATPRAIVINVKSGGQNKSGFVDTIYGKSTITVTFQRIHSNGLMGRPRLWLAVASVSAPPRQQVLASASCRNEPYPHERSCALETNEWESTQSILETGTVHY